MTRSRSRSTGTNDTSVSLCLSGGNALGAYAAGAFEALHAAGYRIDTISGASIGGATAALIAGNRPDAVVDALQAFWSQASSGGWGGAWPAWDGRRPREMRNAAHALHTLAFGRPALFRPVASGLMPMRPDMSRDVALFDNAPTVATLEKLVDFDYLNEHGPRVVLSAVDLESGEPVYFDSRRERITARHVLAGTGLLPCFPPVEVDGRLLGDPGLACNLPLDPLLVPQPQDRLCFAVDLFSAAGARPRSLDAALERAQDIAFGAQTARTIDAFRREQRLRHELQAVQRRSRAKRAAGGDTPVGHVDLVLAAYRAAPHEVGAKTLDFSRASLQDRWDAGRRDMADGIRRLQQRCPDVEDPGFALYRAGGPSEADRAATKASPTTTNGPSPAGTRTDPADARSAAPV